MKKGMHWLTETKIPAVCMLDPRALTRAIASLSLLVRSAFNCDGFSFIGPLAGSLSRCTLDFFFSFYFILIFIGILSLYNFVLVSAVQWSESVINLHISPPSWTSLPPNTRFLLYQHYKPAEWLIRTYHIAQGILLSTL